MWTFILGCRYQKLGWGRVDSLFVIAPNAIRCLPFTIDSTAAAPNSAISEVPNICLDTFDLTRAIRAVGDVPPIAFQPPQMPVKNFLMRVRLQTIKPLLVLKQAFVLYDNSLDWTCLDSLELISHITIQAEVRTLNTGRHRMQDYVTENGLGQLLISLFD